MLLILSKCMLATEGIKCSHKLLEIKGDNEITDDAN